MARRNQNKSSIFSRIKNALNRAFNTITRSDPKPKGKEHKKENVIKRATNRIREAAAKIGSGSTRRIPTAKYSTGEKGWGQDKKGTDYITRKDVRVSKAQYDKLDKFVTKYNEDLDKMTQNIIDNAYEVFPEIEAENMEMSIRRAVERENRRFSNTLFEDLRELNTEDLLERIKDNQEIEDFINQIINKDYYDLGERNEMYKENYIKALYNEWGETTETREIAKIIEDMDTDTFMLSYYNQYSGVDILAIYEGSEFGESGFLKKAKQFFENLKEKEGLLKWN